MSPFDIGDLSPRRYFASVAIALGLIFAFIAGEADSPLSLLLGLMQWQLQSGLAMCALLLSHKGWAYLSWFERLSPWLRLLLSGLTGSLLFAAPALAIDVFLLGEPGERFTAAELVDEFLNLVPPVTFTWLAINAPFVLGLRLQSAPAEAGPIDSASEEIQLPPFMQLVPSDKRGELLYLRAELHYLAVVTTVGKALVLYNLRDAIAELPKQNGLQVHRAFWVNLDRVGSFKRRGRQGVLCMSNGDEVPVSRRRMPDIVSLFNR